LSLVGTNILQHVSKKEDKVIEKEHVNVLGNSSLHVLNLPANYANNAIVQPSIDFPLLHDECPINLCDKELCDSAFVIHMPQLLD
jgi:hypothetical protein